MKLTPRNILLTLFLILTVALSACAPAATPEPTAAPAPTAIPATEAPAAPAAPAGASLVVTGLVNAELTLTTADPAGLEVVKVTAEHPKKGSGDYEGVRLNVVLEKAGLKAGAGALIISASDGFTNEVSLADVKACADCLIGISEGAFNMVMPGLSSKAWVKEVVKIEVVQGAAVQAPAAPANPNLILATTTSTQDSGLLDVLVPLFEQQTGYKVQTVAVGSGAALKMGEEGNADVLLVHAPASEKTLMEAGFGKDRFLVMHNDFILVGPAADPAGVKGLAVLEAFKAIVEAKAAFVTRGDDSGTHKAELALWKKAELDPTTFSADFYISSGQGMGASLTIASEKGAYIMTDRATYLANKDKLQLEILVEKDNALLNVYHVITVNPEKWPKVNADGALAFAKFLTDPATQEVIGKFGVEKYGQSLFIADATKTDADLGLK